MNVEGNNTFHTMDTESLFFFLPPLWFPSPQWKKSDRMNVYLCMLNYNNEI